MLLALTRDVSPSLGRCELTFRSREPIDVDAALAQHRGYERALERLGCAVRRLPAAVDLPDCVFVEDTAVALDELAVLARPGAESRRGEVSAVADALRDLRPLAAIVPPGTLDGGDVLRCGRTLYVGRSGRTNAAGAAQLRELVEPHGYGVREVPVAGCLHLKSAAGWLGGDRVVVCPERVDPSVFSGLDVVRVDPSEPDAANALPVGEAVVHDARFARTRQRLRSHGVEVVPVDASELARAEGGVTCCCILLDVGGVSRS